MYAAEPIVPSGQPVSVISIPSTAQPGYYNLVTSVAESGGSVSGGNAIRIVPLPHAFDAVASRRIATSGHWSRRLRRLSSGAVTAVSATVDSSKETTSGQGEKAMTTARQEKTVLAHHERAEAPGAMLTHAAARALAVLRIATGAVFLWAFLDKTFGLGYATPAARSWLNGGSPTRGFLSNVEVGPSGLQTFFHNIAGTWWADWLFMGGLAGIGIALILGVGMRIAAVAATVMMGMMWLAEFPLDKAGGSTNPIVDYHVVYAISAVALALAYAGQTWGLGRWWARLPFVQRNRWLI